MQEENNSINTQFKPKKVVEEAKNEVILSDPIADAMTQRVKKMISAKSVQVAVKRKTLLFDKENLNEKDLVNILGREDQEFYHEKKELYIESYPDLAEDPFDLDDLHSMIMEQIFQRNLMRKKKKHPFSDIEKEYESSTKRQNELKKSLSVRRTDRVKQKDGKKQQINIANLSVQFQDPDKLREFSERAMLLKEEEMQSGLLGPGKAWE